MSRTIPVKSRRPAAKHFAYRELDGKDRAIFPPPGNLPRYADDPLLARLAVGSEEGVVLAAVGLRHQDADILSDQLFGRIAEQALSGGIDVGNYAMVVDDDDAIEGVIHNLAELGVAFVLVGVQVTVRSRCRLPGIGHAAHRLHCLFRHCVRSRTAATI